MKRRSVLFLLRYDHQQKFGGDVNLMRVISSELGGECDVMFGTEVAVSSSLPDLVIACNLDRPIEAWHHLGVCRRLGIPFIIYALHHPYSGLGSYLRHGATGFRRWIAWAAGYHPVRYEQGLWTVRWLREALRGTFLPYGSVAKAQRGLLAHADALLVVSQAEVEAIREDIGAIGTPVRILPHPVKVVSGPPKEEGRHGIMVPGRVESRKNQMLVLRAAQRMPDLRFRFVGSVSPTEPGYGDAFKSLARGCDNVTWEENLPPDEFQRQLSGSKLVINASWFEVTSLIDLSAIMSGCRLVTGRHSYIKDFGRDVTTFDPSSLDDLVRAIRISLEGHPPARPDWPTAGCSRPIIMAFLK